MKITVKQLKEMIKQEFENVLLEGKHEEETCPECKNAKGKCKCPKNEEKLEEVQEEELSEEKEEESIEEQIVAKVLEALQ